jgi:hypothetical protein
MSQPFHNNLLVVNNNARITNGSIGRIQDEFQEDNAIRPLDLQRGTSLASEKSQISLSKSFFDKEKANGEEGAHEMEIDFPMNNDNEEDSLDRGYKIKNLSKVPTNQKDKNMRQMISQKQSHSNSISEIHQDNQSTNIAQNQKSDKDARKKILWREEGPDIEVN